MYWDICDASEVWTFIPVVLSSIDVDVEEHIYLTVYDIVECKGPVVFQYSAGRGGGGLGGSAGNRILQARS